MARKENTQVDFSYYKPINKVQEEFHRSKAQHKLLIGGYRGGKTYPAIHEALFICFDNPGHEFIILRNTWDSLTENIEKDFIEISKKANAHNPKDWDRTNHNLVLRCGTTVKFRPLSMSRKQFKGMSVCGFLIDDPDIERHKETISFLFTRLTNAAGRLEAKYFATIICANYEGHDWLWKTYIRRKEEGGDGLFAFWWCKTEDNPTLDKNYIETQASIHSQAWMDRYIYMKPDAFAGLVYYEYDPKTHDSDLSWIRQDNTLYKIMVCDLGITHPTVVIKIATDFKKVYIYDEWYHTNIRTADLGNYLLQQRQLEDFQKIYIDPKSCAREQISGISPRQLLRRDFGLSTTIANNSEKMGIEIVKGLLTIREIKEEGHEPKEMHFFEIDPKACPNAVRELETLRWLSPEMADFDELGYKEKVKDVDNDATDCIRYGCVALIKKMKHFRNADDALKARREKQWNDRLKNLKLYNSDRQKKTSAKKLSEIHNKGLTNNKDCVPVIQYGKNQT